MSNFREELKKILKRIDGYNPDYDGRNPTPYAQIIELVKREIVGEDERLFLTKRSNNIFKKTRNELRAEQLAKLEEGK
jgi:hypothetical protein